MGGSHAPRGTSEPLDNLICALYEQSARQPQLYEFKATRRAPRPSEVFEDVNALAEYNNHRARYEQELEAITYQKEVDDKTVAKLESSVKSILPVNTAVMHSYGAQEVELQGRYATFSGRPTDSAGEAPRIDTGPTNRRYLKLPERSSRRRPPRRSG